MHSSHHVIHFNDLILTVFIVCVHYVITEPSVPRSLMFNFISFTTITVSWMPPLMPNGLITRYDLEFKELNDTLFTRRFPSANRRNYTIIDLTPNTIYVIRIAAVTVVGRGPFTTNMTNITLSKFLYEFHAYNTC